MSEIIKQEQGRSMVEMLGVLAVVGVLSVGGIAGYTYAMDKHKSNELLNEASKRAVVVAAQIASGRPVSLREFEDNDTAVVDCSVIVFLILFNVSRVCGHVNKIYGNLVAVVFILFQYLVSLSVITVLGGLENELVNSCADFNIFSK